MDHPCHKCGHDIEDGKAFCSQCGAPQIRVILPEPAIPSGATVSNSVAVAENPLELRYPALPNPLPAARLLAFQPCAIAAGVAILLILLGLNPFVTALGAGFLAVALSRRRSQAITTSTATGAKLGALTGLFLFAISTILELLAIVVLHKGAEVRAMAMDKVQQAVTRYPGPEAKSFLEFANSSDGFTFLLIASLLFALLAFIALGGIGGAIGATILGRKNRP